MAATDYFTKQGYETATTLSSPGYTIGDTSINVVSTGTWPTDTGVIFAIDEAQTVNNEAVRTDGTYNVFQGTVASATQITNVDYIGGDAERNFTAGASTRVYILVSSYQWNRMITGLLTSIDQDGTLKAGAVDVAGVLASNVVTTAKILDTNVTTAKIADLNVTTGKIADSNVTTAKIADGNVTSAKLADGVIVQVSTSELTASATLADTTAIPMDDTIPQNTEGTELITVTITPKSATNYLIVRSRIPISSGAGVTSQQMALFRDTTADALAANAIAITASTGMGNLSVDTTVLAGSTSATTFKVRVGSAGGTSRYNGISGGRLFGAISKGFLQVLEVKAS